MGVKMLRNLTHRSVDLVAARSESFRSSFLQALQHVRHLGFGRLSPMASPHNHWDIADLAIGDPATLVLEVPLGHPRGFAQLADLDHDWSAIRCPGLNATLLRT